MELTAAQLFVKSLEAQGVTHIFGVPGEENLAFLEAVRNSTITFIVTRHEQAAVFMAATFGRLTGKVGVALSTLGPGATNLMTGVAYAQLGGMPLLVITGQKPVRRSKQGRFQILDVVRMMEPVTKFAATIPSADRVSSLVHEAVRRAEGERPGAVHLELPEDVAEERSRVPVIFPNKVRRPAPDPKAISQAVQMIESSRAPLVVIAAGANRKLVRNQLHLFLEKTKIPFITTQMGKGVENENSDLYIGTTALSAGDYVHKAIAESDCIIMLGHDTSEKPPALFLGQKIIHINFYPADIDAVYIPTLEVVGDVSHSLWAMTESITPRMWDFSYFYRVRDGLIHNIRSRMRDASFPFMPERVVSEIRGALGPNGILSLDNGMYKIWIARNYPAFEQNSVLLDNALATMGAGLPAGIAAKLVHPDKPVLVVAGDGGLMMSIAELETAVRLGVDLTILILNDSGFGMIKWKQKDMGLPDFGLSFTNPDFIQLAESFGAHGYRVTNVHELSILLRTTLNTKGIHVIDCPIDYSDTNNALGERLRNELEGI